VLPSEIIRSSHKPQIKAIILIIPHLITSFRSRTHLYYKYIHCERFPFPFANIDTCQATTTGPHWIMFPELYIHISRDTHILRNEDRHRKCGKGATGHSEDPNTFTRIFVNHLGLVAENKLPPLQQHCYWVWIDFVRGISIKST